MCPAPGTEHGVADGGGERLRGTLGGRPRDGRLGRLDGRYSGQEPLGDSLYSKFQHPRWLYLRVIFGCEPEDFLANVYADFGVHVKNVSSGASDGC